MKIRPIAILRTTPPTSPHPRALPTLLDSTALWHQAPVHAVLSADEEASWFRFGLVDPLGPGQDTSHHAVEVRRREQGRGHRVAGLGSVDDLRQLELGGVR